jgi:hypothetical protein
MSLRKLGSFIKIKNNGIQPLGITKNRMLKVWISIWRRICFCFNRIRAKEFEKNSKKNDGYGGCFSFILTLLFSIQSIKQFKKAKEMLEMD